jgi:hypothetical protein
VSVLLFEVAFVARMVALVVAIDEDRERGDGGNSQLCREPSQGKKEHQWTREQPAEQTLAQDRPLRLLAGTIPAVALIDLPSCLVSLRLLCLCAQLHRLAVPRCDRFCSGARGHTTGDSIFRMIIALSFFIMLPVLRLYT